MSNIQIDSRVYEPNDPLEALGIRTEGTVTSIVDGETAYVLWDIGNLSPVPLVELAVIA